MYFQSSGVTSVDGYPSTAWLAFLIFLLNCRQVRVFPRKEILRRTMTTIHSVVCVRMVVMWYCVTAVLLFITWSVSVHQWRVFPKESGNVRCVKYVNLLLRLKALISTICVKTQFMCANIVMSWWIYKIKFVYYSMIWSMNSGISNWWFLKNWKKSTAIFALWISLVSGSVAVLCSSDLHVFWCLKSWKKPHWKPEWSRCWLGDGSISRRMRMNWIIHTVLRSRFVRK